MRTAPLPAPNDIRIIFIGIDGLDGADLHLPKEIAAIQEELTADDLTEALPVYVDPDGTTDTLHHALGYARHAQVLHFSTHGLEHHGLMLRDADRHGVMASGKQLARLLGQFRNLRLIVLGACHQRAEADALTDLFDCVLATSDVVPIDASRQFMRAFYKGLARGHSVGRAFETAKARIAIDAPRTEHQFWLVHREAIDPQWVQLDPVGLMALTAGQRSATAEYLRKSVDSFQDVVLTANVNRWEDAVLHGPSAAPHVIPIAVPERGAGWHRDWPPVRDEWLAVAEEIRRAVRVIREGEWTRIHVVVNLPYSLAALLACELQAMNHELVFYQWTPPKKRAEGQRAWEPWGPGLSEAMRRYDTSFFEHIKWPRHPVSGFIGEVAITVGVSRPIASDLVHAAAPDRHRIRVFPLVPRGRAGQAIVDQHNIECAAGELDEAIRMAGASFPNASAIHLFAAAPNVLIMRGTLRVATSPVRVIVNEFFPTTPRGSLYLPVIDLKDGVVRPFDDEQQP